MLLGHLLSLVAVSRPLCSRSAVLSCQDVPSEEAGAGEAGCARLLLSKAGAPGWVLCRVRP